MKRTTALHLWTLFNEREAKMLTTPAHPVDLNGLADSATQQLIDNMLATMRRAEGIGLAAPQIGQSLQLAVIAPEVDAALAEPLIVVNPKLVHLSAETMTGEEGCLSIPRVFGLVVRATQVTARFFDRHGRLTTLTAGDLLARVIQHEVDHLNGRLFIDRITSYTRGQELLP
ncbi:MAG: peptide deformylase [Patescibacteria group bacterium]